MRYLVQLYADETTMPMPGTPEFDADLKGYEAFDELARGAIVGGEALHDNGSCRTIRHTGGSVQVTDGPFAETVEGMGGFFVLEADTLDDVIELARMIPAANDGAIEIRPLVQWFDRTADAGASTRSGASVRYFATIHGPETEADVPGTAAWDAGAEEHGRFAARAGDTLVAGGAVQPVASATTIRVRDGELLITDGPFAEAMEVVGGVYVLNGTEDEVIAAAKAIPVNDGGAVQLRAIMELDG